MARDNYPNDVLTEVIQSQKKRIDWMSKQLTKNTFDAYSLVFKPVGNPMSISFLSFKIEILLSATKLDFTIKELAGFFNSDLETTEKAYIKAKKRAAFFKKYYLLIILGLITVIGVILGSFLYVGIPLM